MNPKPLPGVIRSKCRKCGGERQHFGIGSCWKCMTLEEKEKFKHE